MILIFLFSLIYLIQGQETFLSTCTEGDEFEFIFINERVNFDEGVESCDRLSPAAQLASIPDETTENFVEDFLSSIQGEITESFILFGLFSELRISRDPEDFSFIDGTQFVDNFAQEGGESPWKEDRPNGNDSNCVGMERNGFEWDDIDCNRNENVLCKRPCTQNIDDPDDDDDGDDGDNGNNPDDGNDPGDGNDPNDGNGDDDDTDDGEGDNDDEEEVEDLVEEYFYVIVGGGGGCCCLVCVVLFLSFVTYRSKKRKRRKVFKSYKNEEMKDADQSEEMRQVNPMFPAASVIVPNPMFAVNPPKSVGKKGPRKSYLKATQRLPESFRSIFAPSPRFIKENIKTEHSSGGESLAI